MNDPKITLPTNSLNTRIQNQIQKLFCWGSVY